MANNPIPYNTNLTESQLETAFDNALNAVPQLSDDLTAEIARAQRAEELLQKDTFGVPEGRVTSGSNMDDYTTNGAYLCLSSAVGKSLINCPVEAGFRLEVKALAAGTERCIQILYPNINNDVIFYSRRLVSTGWTDWYALTGVIAPVINTVAEPATVSETEEI